MVPEWSLAAILEGGCLFQCVDPAPTGRSCFSPIMASDVQFPFSLCACVHMPRRGR